MEDSGNSMSDLPPWNGVPEPEHITRIRVLFAGHLSERVRAIRGSFGRLAQGMAPGATVAPLANADRRAAARTLFLEAHRIAGSAASFGATRLGEVATRIDHWLRASQDSGTLPSIAEIRAIGELIPELEESERQFLRWMEASGFPGEILAGELDEEGS